MPTRRNILSTLALAPAFAPVGALAQGRGAPLPIPAALARYNQAAKAQHADNFSWFELVTGSPASADQLAQLQARCGLPIPPELQRFYRELGSVRAKESLSECYLRIPSVASLLQGLAAPNTWARRPSLGLVDAIVHSWGNDRPEFAPGKFFSADQLKALNAQYIGFGLYRPDLERAHYLYFDAQGRFGALFYDQDDFSDAQKRLTAMLRTSPAPGDLASVIGHSLDALRQSQKE